MSEVAVEPSNAELRRKGRLGRAFIALLALTPTLLAMTGVPICPTAGFFGKPCPGCGLTRATLAAFRGDFATAFAMHPLFFIAAPVAVGGVAWVVFGYVRGGSDDRQLEERRDKLVTKAALGMMVLLLALWVSRFFGAFGGPVPVTSYWEMSHEHAASVTR